MSQGDNDSIRSEDMDYPGGWWPSPRDLSRSCSSLVLYVVSSLSKGWVYSLGMCYNLIPVFSIKALRGNKVILRRTSAILQEHFLQVKSYCCLRWEEAGFFWQGRGSLLLGCRLRKFWTFQICTLIYPNVPFLGFWSLLFEDSDLVKRSIEAVHSVSFGALWTLLWNPVHVFQYDLISGYRK